jgi:cytochrome P450
VVMPQWAVHRSARWFSKPESFLPGRWTPSFRKSLPKFAFFPFSGGARTCVGGQIAWSESAVILALLAQHFRFSLCEATPLVPYEGLTLLPGSGRLQLQLERRPTTRVSRNVKRKRPAWSG